MPDVTRQQAFLGEAIRTARCRKALSREALAYKAKITVKTLRKVENGQTTTPHHQTIQKIAKALGVEPEQLASLPSSDRSIAKIAQDLEALVSAHCLSDCLNGNIENLALRETSCKADSLSSVDDAAARLTAALSARNRREVIQALTTMVLASAAGAGVASAGAGQAEALRSIEYGLDGRRVGSEVAERARDQIALLSQLDDQIGGKRLYGVARSNLILLQKLLQMRAVSGRDEQDLRRVLAHAASQAGWFAQDAERRDVAAQHYRFGIEMAQSAGEKDRAAYCMLRLADQVDALTRMPAGYVRERSVMLMQLAKSKQALGDTDEALNAANEVLHVVTNTSTPRVEKQLSEFCMQLPDDPVARPFKERFAEYKRVRVGA